MKRLSQSEMKKLMGGAITIPAPGCGGPCYYRSGSITLTSVCVSTSTPGPNPGSVCVCRDRPTLYCGFVPEP